MWERCQANTRIIRHVGIDGAGLYSNDDGHDARAMFRESIAEGLSPEEATTQLQDNWKGVHEQSPETASLFWLALADTQWNTGRLLDEVRNASNGDHRKRIRLGPLSPQPTTVEAAKAGSAQTAQEA